VGVGAVPAAGVLAVLVSFVVSLRRRREGEVAGRCENSVSASGKASACGRLGVDASGVSTIERGSEGERIAAME
jgi:hypothetical protein